MTQSRTGRRVVVGFNRDRDSYQVAAAVSEAQGADLRLITDYYHGRGLQRLGSLSHRRSDLVPARAVRSVPSALVAQVSYELRRRYGCGGSFPTEVVDRRIAQAIRRSARKFDATDVIAYSNYAHLAFRSDAYRRVLFQFHPGRSAVVAGLGLDSENNSRDWLRDDELTNVSRESNYWSEIELADHIIVASSFTKRGLVTDGVTPERVTVVPYGCPPGRGLPDREIGRRSSKRVEFLYIGQGIRRKGLHLLLEAWRELRMDDAGLTVVSRFIDSAIDNELLRTPNISVISDATSADLGRLMHSADYLVVPSLVEGFGLVLGEALGAGMRLVATENTGLVDLDLPDGVARHIDAGSVDSLKQALSELASRGPLTPSERAECLQLATDRSWQRFRESVRNVLNLPIAAAHG